ncbi:RNA polymerase sigma factor [Sphingobacterium sp. xlx-130]|uniref:RNA polymerase sigma factor n=1 Tax=Sphingobacterium sp. xlx-130 TaxID=2654323 RepID=UPI0013DCA294|nr:RNA polymerase sigma-70 factor [Sphingobacterium sp. xlx-130]
MNRKLDIESEDSLRLVKKDFDLVFNSLYDPLLFFATKYLKRIDLSEEIVLDSFLKLWQKIDHFHFVHEAKSYLYVCTRNACINQLRDQKRKPISENITDLESVLLDGESDILSNILQAELLTSLYRKIHEMPDIQRKVFNLLYMEDLTYEEVSKKLNISIEAVYAHKSRAMKFLKCKIKYDLIILLFLIYTAN